MHQSGPGGGDCSVPLLLGIGAWPWRGHHLAGKQYLGREKLSQWWSPIGRSLAFLYDPRISSGKRRGKGKHDLRRIMPLWKEGEPVTHKVQERLSDVQYRRGARTTGFKVRMTQIWILVLGGFDQATWPPSALLPWLENKHINTQLSGLC